MVALEPIKLLREKKAQLLQQQAELIEVLKTKHADLYNWMLENKIQPTELKVYAAGLAAAATVALAAQVPIEERVNALVPHVQVIEVQELSGKTEEEKAQIVWDRYGHVIKRNSARYEVDERLIFATIMLESGGNTYAIRHEPQIGDSSYGLGQILYGTARGIGFEGSPQDLYDPEVNIDLIARYHARNKSVYGEDLTDEQLTIAYNAGSPYSNPYPGHIMKFNRWYSKVDSFIG